MARAAGILLLSLCLLFSGPLFAHRLKVFATAQGARIDGSVYFVGGGKAAGVKVTLLDPNGRELARLTTDEQGAFSYTATQRTDHQVVADSLDGHRASWTVAADELPAALPAPGAGAGTAAIVPAIERATEAITPPAPEAASDLSEGATVALVEQAVARQVRPLRQQLTAYGDQVRLHDILGGLGYIAGLAGLAMWWRSRRRAE